MIRRVPKTFALAEDERSVLIGLGRTLRLVVGVVEVEERIRLWARASLVSVGFVGKRVRVHCTVDEDQGGEWGEEGRSGSVYITGYRAGTLDKKVLVRD